MMNTLDGLTIVYDSSETEYYVTLEQPLSYTSFTMVDANHKTQILDWMSSVSSPIIYETIIIESETRPDIDNLTSAQLNSVFNSPSLKLVCNDTWTGDFTEASDKVRLDFDITTKAGTPAILKYSPQLSTSPIVNEGKWDGATGFFLSVLGFDTTDKVPEINEFYFVRSADGAEQKVKLSEGTPENSYCQESN